MNTSFQLTGYWQKGLLYLRYRYPDKEGDTMSKYYDEREYEKMKNELIKDVTTFIYMTRRR